MLPVRVAYRRVDYGLAFVRACSSNSPIKTRPETFRCQACRSRTGQAVVGVSLQEGQVDRRAIGPLPVAGGVGVQADHHGLRVSSHSQVQLVVVLLVVDAVEMAARLLQQPPESATTSLEMRLSRERTLTWQKFSASSNVMSSPMTIWPGAAYCRRQAGQQAKDGKPVAVLTKPQMKPSTCHAAVGSATPAVLTSWKPPVPSNGNPFASSWAVLLPLKYTALVSPIPAIPSPECWRRN